MKTRILFVALMMALAFVSCKNSSKFSPDLFPVKKGDLWGYVDKKGNEVIAAQFNEADYFSGGLALVSKGGSYGFIDDEGKWVVKAVYKAALPFSEELACVVKNDSAPAYIDTKGNFVFELPIAIEAGSFHNGLAKFKDSKGKWGFVDKKGTVKITAQYDDVLDFFNEMAAVKINGAEGEEGKWGYINAEGSYAIHPQFTEVGPFTGDYALVSNGKAYGFINKKGEYVVQPQFDEALDFINESAPVSNENGWGYINAKGEFIVQPQFDGALFFSENLALVSKDGKCGYVDKEGKFVINPTYDEASMFIGDIAIVKSLDKYGFIDRKGKFLADPAFDEVDIMGAVFYSCFGMGYSYYKNTVTSDLTVSGADIETVVKEFVKSLTKCDSSRAMNLATKGSREFVRFVCSVNQVALSGETPEVKIENMSCTQEGIVAKCSYTENDEPKTIDLVNENGKWLVDMSQWTMQ